jgi:glutamyl-tRNA synthetase
VYCHTALLMKTENGKKRKLSKRLDPELALSYYISEGYHPKSIEEYMLTIINSNYEEWRLANSDAPAEAFTVTTAKMGSSGILFDLDKLSDISKDTLVKIPADELAAFMLDWAGRAYPEALPVLEKDFGLLMAALDVGRTGDKPRKDLSFAKQIFSFISFYFDEWYQVEDSLPENVPAADASAILKGYLETYAHTDDRNAWFEKIRELAVSLGYAAKPRDYKKDPDAYKGHVGDVSAVIRLALTGRRDSPDIWEIQQVLGEDRVRARISSYMFSTSERPRG